MLRLSAGAGAAALAVTLVCASSRVSAQIGKVEPVIDNSVEGVLDQVVTDEKGVIVRTDDGHLVAWRLPAPAIAEAAKFAAGTRVFVLYRGLDPDERAVTALGFPEQAREPLYVNATEYDVVVRATPEVNGRCGVPGPAPVTEREIARGLFAAIQGACWCCAPKGQTCTPSGHSRNARVVLAQCFGTPAP
jgi:hypothetical protein